MSRKNQPCECGSGIKARLCCVGPPPVGWTPPSRIAPPGPVTGFSHPECFASADGNCAQRISKEHFISAALIEAIVPHRKPFVEGFNWLQPGQRKAIPIPALASHVLCERHNSALSGLDAAFELIGGKLAEFEQCAKSERAFGDLEFALSGHDLERWALKFLAGSIASENLLVKDSMKNLVNMLYDLAAQPRGFGLYIPSHGMEVRAHARIHLQIVSDGDTNEVTALLAAPYNLPLCFIINPSQAVPRDTIRRPSHILLRAPTGSLRFNLSWAAGGAERGWEMSRVGTVSGPIPSRIYFEVRDGTE